ncbi:MAG: thioesterase [Bacteroidetes bacterium]|nr:thioesterase [Bacteroidota bacterium]
MEKHPQSSYTVRFNDCDPLGHLNNSRYLDYFINAREDHLKSAYGIDLTKYYQKGQAWVVGHHEILYKKPAVYNEEVLIRTSLIDLSDYHLTIEAVMYDKDGSHIKAVQWTSLVSINSQNGRKEAHDPEFMDFARSVHDSSVDLAQGVRARVAQLKS